MKNLIHLEHETKHLSSQIGTLVTKAPELLKADVYNSKVDMWSLGVTFYYMLFGNYPYLGAENKMLKLINKNKLDLSKNGIDISYRCKDLLTKMLNKDPKKRIDWQDIYQHPLL